MTALTTALRDPAEVRADVELKSRLGGADDHADALPGVCDGSRIGVHDAPCDQVGRRLCRPGLSGGGGDGHTALGFGDPIVHHTYRFDVPELRARLAGCT